jgi:hypothetical protein
MVHFPIPVSDGFKKSILADLAIYVSPVVGKLPVSAVDTGLVLKVLEPTWTKNQCGASAVRCGSSCRAQYDMPHPARLR